MPKRIQRKRTKGWKMPDNAVYVGRGSVWGNPYRVENGVTRLIAKMQFRQMVEGNVWSTPNKDSIKEALRGKDLACWCTLGQPCHADVLLEIANK